MHALYQCHTPADSCVLEARRYSAEIQQYNLSQRIAYTPKVYEKLSMYSICVLRGYIIQYLEFVGTLKEKYIHGILDECYNFSTNI